MWLEEEWILDRRHGLLLIHRLALKSFSSYLAGRLTYLGEPGDVSLQASCVSLPPLFSCGALFMPAASWRHQFELTTSHAGASWRRLKELFQRA